MMQGAQHAWHLWLCSSLDGLCCFLCLLLAEGLERSIEVTGHGWLCGF